MKRLHIQGITMIKDQPTQETRTYWGKKDEDGEDLPWKSIKS